MSDGPPPPVDLTRVSKSSVTVQRDLSAEELASNEQKRVPEPPTPWLHGVLQSDVKRSSSGYLHDVARETEAEARPPFVPPARRSQADSG